jgi:hypothetical protein
MISFCTWIKNRFTQFEQVYRINLERMRECDEWIIVDVDSDDEFSTWSIDDERVKIHRIKHKLTELYNQHERL